MEVKEQLQVPVTLRQGKELMVTTEHGLGTYKKKKISYPFRESKHDF
jgi:hypothetical protein